MSSPSEGVAVGRRYSRLDLGYPDRLGSATPLGEENEKMDVNNLISEHGAWFYLFTFGWTFIEGETFVLLAGFAAAQGLLSAPLLLLAAWLGSFAGDQCYFWIGRRFGLRLLSRRPYWRARVDSALGWVKRYDKWFILSFRFIYGVRNFSSFALGISGIGWQRFLIFNFIAALLWAVVFVGMGYFFGRVFERALGEFADEFKLAMLGIFAVVLITIGILHRLRQRRRRQAAEAASPSS
jgi:membrane protein DedA with SNARE-associated domain